MKLIQEEHPNSQVAKNWKLVWHDEFDGPADTLPDSAKWRFDTGGHGWGNLEKQYYIYDSQNVSLDGRGCLVILANEAVDNTKLPDAWYGPAQYFSARLTTKSVFEFLYGRIESRIKIPTGQGVWSAFWLLGANIDTLPWPSCGEIDIMENIGREPSQIHGSIHGPGYSRLQAFSQVYQLPENQPFHADFHKYAVEWEPEQIRWFVDEEEFLRFSSSELDNDLKWVFDHPFFLVLNVAIGGLWPGYPDKSTRFPQKMLVDYVRIYQSEISCETFR